RKENLVEYDPERAEFIKERLNTIYRLQKKHRVNTIGELISIQQDLQQKADLTNNLDETLAKARASFETAESNLKKTAQKLTQGRKKVMDPIASELVVLLKELGIQDATVTFEHKSIPFTSTGA